MRAIVLAVVTTSLVVADPASAGQNSGRSTHVRCADKQLKQTYSARYHRVARSFGARTPGRNILRHGLRPGQKATCRHLGRSARTLKRWLAPPQAAVMRSDRTPTTWRTAPSSTGGRYAIPAYIVQCESRGSYTAVNPSSGAYGAYQVIPSTAAAYGCNLSTPGGQDSCAAKIWADRGASAWSCG